MEPRLVVFKDNEGKCNQGFIVAEQEVLFEVSEFSIVKGLISFIATYYCLYIGYPKSVIAADELLFVQQDLVGIPDATSIKKRLKYNSCTC